MQCIRIEHNLCIYIRRMYILLDEFNFQFSFSSTQVFGNKILKRTPMNEIGITRDMFEIC